MTFSNVSDVHILGTVFFALAVLHTFLVSKIIHWSHRYPEGSIARGVLHLVGEIEIVFGIWAAAFLLAYSVMESPGAVVAYQESLHYTEPLFVFCVMVIAATKPVLSAASSMINFLSMVLQKVVRVPDVQADLLVVMIVGPLAGSFITEPAAMTVTALLLNAMIKNIENKKFLYSLIAVLFVNVSIGGALTAFAAPPILMVAGKWSWDSSFVFTHFGWKSLIAVIINAHLLTFFFWKDLGRICRSLEESRKQRMHIPLWVTILHYLFLVLVVLSAHHPNTAMGIFLLFLGVTTVTNRYQERLRLRESLLVAFFLGGIMIFGAFQRWWLEPLLSAMGNYQLFFGATALTAVTDNAALTYLGAQVDGLAEASKYFLVAGAITGGGLTVIANAPNAAGYSILNNKFTDGINPMALLGAALVPTAIAAICLGFL